MKPLFRFFSRHRQYRHISEEIQQHLDEKIEELVQEGLSREEAAAAAHRIFGNAVLMEEQSREAWGFSTLEGIGRDIRYALRQLRRTPGFTLTVLLTLTLAISANTAVFSIINALLLRPLPYPQPDHLAAVARNYTAVLSSGKTLDESEVAQDGETWELVRDRVSAAEAAAFSASVNGINVQAGSQRRYLQNQRVSATYFDVLGIKPFLGRTFTQEEDIPHGPNAVVLSYESCASLFDSGTNCIGQTIRIKGEPFTVVGVLPPHVQTTALADVWTPLQPRRGGEGGGNNYQILLRLRPGASWAAVEGQLQPLHPAMFDRLLQGAKVWLAPVPLQKALAEEKRAPSLTLMAAVVLILLIACVNLSGLMLVRHTRRAGEIATRMALGASRGAILRQVMLEPLLLALAGGASGLTIAVLSLKSLTSLFPPELLPLGRVSVDARVLAFAIAATLCTSFLVALLPALASGHLQIRPALGSRGFSTGTSRNRTRQMLIGAEVCLTLVLLAGAGLLIRTLVYLQTLPPGFDGTNVIAGKASLDDARYHDPMVFQDLLQRSLEAMERIPGVESAAMGLSLPYERGLNDGFAALDGPHAGESMASSTSYITPAYFRTLRIPVLAGRTFLDSDTSESEPVVIVNTSFAKQHLGTLDVIGRHLKLGKTVCTVVGLVGDVKKRPGIVVNAPLSAEPMFYVPAAQMTNGLQMIHVWFQPSWIVRTRGAVAGVTEAMQQALSKADPNLPFSGFYKMGDLEARALSQQRLEVTLFSVLAGLALLLSAIGVYGLVSNWVVQRTREMGIRLALGSTVGRAMMSIASAGMVAVSAGIVAGLVLAGLTLRLVQNQLYGVRAHDPFTLVTACFVLTIAAVGASVVPTLRIARIDPATTLRAE